MPQTYLIVGATGKVGSHLVPLLTRQGHTVRAATRMPGGYAAPDENVQAVRFDYDDASTYAPALSGADGLFLIAKSGDPHSDRVMIPFLDEARKAGVGRIVLLTAMGVEHATDAPLRKVERHLEGLDAAHTILRPNWFMQNFTEWLRPMLRQGALRLPAGDAAVSFVDVRDIAAVAAAALTQDGHAGQAYPLTGPEALTHAEAVALMAEAAGRALTYVPISDDDFRRAFAKEGWPADQIEFMLMLFQSLRAGHAAPVSPAGERVTGRAAGTFRAFARRNADAWR